MDRRVTRWLAFNVATAPGTKYIRFEMDACRNLGQVTAFTHLTAPMERELESRSPSFYSQIRRSGTVRFWLPAGV